MKIADLYIRVSTDEQADKGYSQRDQEDRLRHYCKIKGFDIRHVFIEDHSAKTFERPEWKNYLSILRKSKNNKVPIALLFTKWDRFSRNAADAYQMIKVLRAFGVEPEAIEQPLDLSVPENKIMLAFYLATPEVENDRRSLNVFHGMRRAKKEGRCMGTAPLGYTNKIAKDKRKYIAIDDFAAPLLRWAFEQIIENNFNTEQVWKLLREKSQSRVRFSKNNFWRALRNPLYCGKIFIPPYKDEDGHFVVGQHEPLISEHMFDEVQRVLDGRKRILKPKVVSPNHLPLRGFLKCSNCGKTMTGSASKGKMGRYYHYYHCSSTCGVRFKAEVANDAFINQLRNLVPKQGILDLFTEAFVNEFEQQTKMQSNERMDLLKQIETQNQRLKNALV
ncbi:recombinase family protein [Sphingobacterium hungaricum]|uniref:recombinase family protein n=1 Tax=Sphingobacterium hungaricum TaxID=2082723 RepID=UPI001E59820F|nr:recombinase family protein [Sphingobacterium hungaricum]